MNNKHLPSVSVVIPCLNAATTVEAAITSVVQQKNVALQIICVEDNSNDKTPKILARLAAQGIVEHVLSDGPCNASAARNRGLKIAQGDYIQFLDADDTLLEGKLHRQTRIIKKNNADFVAGAYHLNHLRGGNSTIYPDQNGWNGLITSRLGKTSANLFRRKPLQAIDGWSVTQKSSQEYQLMFRLLKNNARVAFDTQVGTIINATQGGISHRNQHDNVSRFIELRSNIIDYLKHHNQLTDEQQTLYDSICQRSIAELEKIK